MADLVVLAIGLVLGSACTVGYFALGRHAERLSRLELWTQGTDAFIDSQQRENVKAAAELERLNKDAGSFAERLNIRRND